MTDTLAQATERHWQAMLSRHKSLRELDDDLKASIRIAYDIAFADGFGFGYQKASDTALAQIERLTNG